MRCVGTGNIGRIEVFPNYALRRGCFFHFGNDGRFALFYFAFQGVHKAAQIFAALGLAQDLCLAAHLARGGHFGLFCFQYFLKDVTHDLNFRV